MSHPIPDDTGLVRWWAADDLTATTQQTLPDRVLGFPMTRGSTSGVDANDPDIALAASGTPGQWTPDGVNDYLQTDYTPTVTATTGALTVVVAGVWDDADTDGSNTRIISSEPFVNRGLIISTDAPTRSRPIAFLIGSSSAATANPGGSLTPLSDGDSFVSAAVVDAGALRSYLHGPGLGASADTAGVGTVVHSPVRLGTRGFDAAHAAKSSNRHVLIFERALIEAELDALSAALTKGHPSRIPSAIGYRVSQPTAALPQSTDGALFTVSGGRVLITGLVGEVTTVIETQANATKLKFNPTGTGADQDLCATLDITGDAVGEIYTISGTVGDAMRSDLLGGLPKLESPLLLSEGSIELDCAASNTGQVKWDVWYYPLDQGATIVAA